MAGGRPTKYKPEYCEALIQHMENGNSFWSFAAEVDVCFQTLDDWCGAHPEFLESKRRGMSKLLRFDEKIARAGSTGQLKRHARTIKTSEQMPDGTTQTKEETIYDSAQFSQTYQIFLMKNRYPRMYRDKIQVESSSGDDAKKLGTVLQEVMNDPALAAAAKIIAEKLSEE